MNHIWKHIYLQLEGKWRLPLFQEELSGCFERRCLSPPPSTFLTLFFHSPSSTADIQTSQVLPGFLRLVLTRPTQLALSLGCTLLPLTRVLLLVLFESSQESGNELVSRFVGGGAARLLLLLLAVSPLQPYVSVGRREQLMHRLRNIGECGYRLKK